jgi:uncharacterized membrane protein YbhN (UPF0104 family)
MNSSLRNKVSLIVLLVCLAFLAHYVAYHLSDFRVLLQISVPYLSVICFLFFILVVLNGLFLKFLIADFGIGLSFAEYLSISIVTTFANSVLPFRGGAGFKAIYLKEKHNFDYSYFIASHAGSYLIILNANSVIALGGMAVLYLQKTYFNLPLAIACAGICLASSYAILFAPGKIDWVPFRPLREILNRILSGWAIIKSSKRNVLRLVWVGTLSLLLAAVITYFEFAACGMKDVSGNPIGLLQAIVFSSFSVLSLLLAVTPAALGVKEGLLMFCSDLLGITPSQALAVSILDRAAGFAVVLLLFNLASLYLKRELKSQPLRQDTDKQAN